MDISENLELRKLIWLFHSDSHELFGENGEMSCSCGIDFKRDTIDNIAAELFSCLNPLYVPNKHQL